MNTPSNSSSLLLDISDLQVSIPQRKGRVSPLRGVDLQLDRGRTLGIVGESGSGKTMTALSVMGLLPSSGTVSGGSIRFDGTDLVRAGDEVVRRLRGTEIGMIFQDPMTSLNPTMSIGDQIAEPLRVHERVSKADARTRAIDMLRRVGMPRPDRIAADYPHQLSGGMRQRAMIAMALINRPKLLIADEPTTALDVTTQRQILDLIDDLKEEMGSAAILVTHDLGVVAGRADEVAVMYAGRIVETGPARDLFGDPEHQYTRALLAALPERSAAQGRRLYAIPGMPPGLREEIEGCPFAPRCHAAQDDCRTGTIELMPMPGATAGSTDGSRHSAACLHPGSDAPITVPEVLEAAEATAADLEAGASGADTHVPRAEAGRHRAQGHDSASTAPGETAPVLEVEAVTKQYAAMGGSVVRRRVGTVSAVDDVSFTVRAGETFGLVGESGCGKSTLGRVIASLEGATAGSVRIAGGEVATLRGAARKRVHREVQMMFQDSAAAMDPRMRIDEILTEPLDIQRIGTSRSRGERAEDLVRDVGLAEESLERYPHEFSGGQLQRIGLARSLALDPRLIVCDEPVSALDVSVQAQVLNLMRDVQVEHGLGYVFISHDLSVVRYMSDRIGVMYLGAMVEVGPAEDVAARPRHPYTRVLIDAVPTVDPEDGRERLTVGGELPSALDPPSGCRFRTRCPFAQDICATTPPLVDLSADDAGSAVGTHEEHLVACHFPLPAEGSLPAVPSEHVSDTARTPERSADDQLR